MDDGSVYSDDMDDMPMPNPSRHIPINSLLFCALLKKLIESKPYLALRLHSTNQASPHTSPFLVAQESLNITILNKLPIAPNLVPDTTSMEYSTKVTLIQTNKNHSLPHGDVLDYTVTPPSKNSGIGWKQRREG
ncbi:hypothetical protein BLNAU_15389 [Blattamonas nauphoetae]|uniref:Uncharacterized protein n=1 Tax=Blattamonas nauphoetae TaxID=2049346 RepID=A0ABQ9XEC1_9EUKA|nr:hypothetical protein BLNAU_15389 [Blattamonas nauphoetae]